jgi:hypothetical protein
MAWMSTAGGGCGYEVSMVSNEWDDGGRLFGFKNFAIIIPRMKRQAPTVCPVCGEDVPRGALACPECGADHSSGWREEAGNYDGVDLPDEFDYEEFTRREFGSSLKPAGCNGHGSV